MLSFLLRGGPVAWLLALLAVLAAFIFLERFFHLHRAQIAADDFLKGVYNILSRGNAVEAASICEDAPGPVARLALAAVLHADDPPELVARAVIAAGLDELPRMERGLGWLAAIARIAPFAGLLGTVLCLMGFLEQVRLASPLVQPADLSGALYHALATTAFSLVVALLSHAGYAFLVSRVESISLDMEKSADSLVDFMRRLRSARAPAPSPAP